MWETLIVRLLNALAQDAGTGPTGQGFRMHDSRHNMIRRIHLLNGAAPFAHSGGRLGAELHQRAGDYLRHSGYETRQTVIHEGYDIEQEVGNILWADALIYQIPGWWMDVPWMLKKYMDEVFTAGHGLLYRNDGRTRSDASKRYGSGGLVQGKSYMISTTWNAPEVAFTDSDDFFEGRGVDGVFFPFHKAHQFLGFQSLPTFMVNDVIKAPAIEKTLEAHKAHLVKTFPAIG